MLRKRIAAINYGQKIIFLGDGMAKDDYFKIVYAILVELYDAKKSGTKVALDAIHPERFGIPT